MIVTSIIGIMLSFLWFGIVFGQLDFIEPDNPSVTQDIEDVVDTTDVGGQGNSIRAGTRFPVASPSGTDEIGILDEGEIQTYEQGQLQTLDFIKRIINYFLGFLGLIALILFIYTGFRLVLAGTDDNRYKEATSQFRKVSIAIGGIWLSWFIVTFIFYVVWLIVS